MGAAGCALGANVGVNVLADGLKLKDDALGLRPAPAALRSAEPCPCGCWSRSSQESAIVRRLHYPQLVAVDLTPVNCTTDPESRFSICLYLLLCGLCIGSLRTNTQTLLGELRTNGLCGTILHKSKRET